MTIMSKEKFSYYLGRVYSYYIHCSEWQINSLERLLLLGHIERLASEGIFPEFFKQVVSVEIHESSLEPIIEYRQYYGVLMLLCCP